MNALNLAAETAANPTVTVFRVEGATNQRLLIDEAGNVSLTPGDKTVWLNFGEADRATSYFGRKIDAGLPDVQLKSFEVDPKFLQQLQETSVPESLARTFPDRPIISADPYPNQFGVRPNQFQQLLDSIYQGTGKSVRPGGN